MKKVISLLLCFALIIPLALQASAEKIYPPSHLITEKTEVLSKRSTYSKTYQLPNGTYLYAGYSEPIHYKDNTGAYIEINNEITSAVRQAGYKFANTANAWQTHFSDKLNDNDAVMLTSGKYNIAFSFTGQAGTALAAEKTTVLSQSAAKDTLSTYHQKLSQDNRAVIYRDVAENVDIAYTVKTEGLKEDIVLKTKGAPSVYKFRLTTNGLLLQETDGTVGLFTPAGEDVFTFAPLYMEDANGKRSEQVMLTYTSVKNGYELTVSADPAFLNAADTAYPVVIDPSIMVSGSSVTYDTCVDQQYPSSNYYLSESLWTGGAYGTNAMRTYIKFDLPDDFYGFQVNYAYISIRQKDYLAPTIRAYRVTGSWSSSSVTWYNQPNYSSADYSPRATNSTGDWYNLDIKEFVQNWVDGVYPNHGLVLMEPGEMVSEQKTKFYSSDAPSPNKPELIINYNEYYGSRPFQPCSSEDVNCLGYALEYPVNITPQVLRLLDADMLNKNRAQLTAYFKTKLTQWITEVNTDFTFSLWEDSTPDSIIRENWFLISIEVVILKDEGRIGIYDSGEGLGYHCRYKTNTGVWAEKPGPTTDDAHTVFYTPTTGDNIIFLQIRDIRDINQPLFL